MDVAPAIDSITPIEDDTDADLVRAAELIEVSIAALCEEVDPDGTMARTASHISRYAQAMMSGFCEIGEIVDCQRSLAHLLSIGNSMGPALSGRGHQSLRGLEVVYEILRPFVSAATGVAQPALKPESSSPPAPYTGPERRSPRVKLETEVELEGESNFYTGFTEDISEGGLFLATYGLLPIGTVIDLEFTLPTGHLVSTPAEVRWLRDLRDLDTEGMSPGMGLQFLELAPSDKAEIRAFIQARAPLFFD